MNKIIGEKINYTKSCSLMQRFLIIERNKSNFYFVFLPDDQHELIYNLFFNFSFNFIHAFIGKSHLNERGASVSIQRTIK